MVEYVSRKDMCIGMIITYVSTPLVVIGEPYQRVPDDQNYWRARVGYLRDVDTGSWSVTAGKVVEFNISLSQLWPHPLSDEEEALAMRLILTHG